VQDHLGDALFQQGNVEGALEAWSRALEGDGEAVDRAAIERKIESAREKTKSR
jgi:predicted negative regulator of RcsB-dependent stress response